ncbi:hypothetical protein [Chryseobacterium mucoviscidosis]|uniref:Uncharacterized protein n=1 Tax=Chryseobacterium mucoviscidosis TaxID=1945581 RepID=A0A202BR90_9FLAO|nr:hypothetical protein [Chryseobacterium mucoviscidosis]OVE53984.1 hypothetical protein B0E34_20365 [Chryseobacterium mucoviscidosis]
MTNNTQNISEKYKSLRIERVNSWKPRLENDNYDFLFPIEFYFLTRIREKLSNNKLKLFAPLKYPYELDKDYHIYISYLIESLDVLPLKMDLAFDFSWKGLEFYMGKAYELHKGQNCINASDLIKYSKSNYWFDVISNNQNIKNSVESFLELMPSQSYEYLAKRMLDNYSITNPKANPLYTRIAMSNGNLDIKLDNLLKDLYTKYGNLTNGEDTRKVGRIVFKLLNGENINLEDSLNSTQINTYFFDLKEKIDLVVNGLIYTYRNERFHGNTFSPFKSSKASLQTYSHAQYLFFWTYFLVNITKLYINNINISIQEVSENMSTNIESFKKLYGRHLKK